MSLVWTVEKAEKLASCLLGQKAQPGQERLLLTGLQVLGGEQFLWNGGGGQRKKLSLASLLLCVIDAAPLFRAAALTPLIFVNPTWKHLSGMSSAAYLSKKRSVKYMQLLNEGLFLTVRLFYLLSSF